MAGMLSRTDPQTTALLELRALQRMVRVLCEQIEQMIHDARTRGELASREADFQLQAFAERSIQAEQLLAAGPSETVETRITRLQRLVEALECSRDYFRPGDADNGASEWAIRVR